MWRFLSPILRKNTSAHHTTLPLCHYSFSPSYFMFLSFICVFMTSPTCSGNFGQFIKITLVSNLSVPLIVVVIILLPPRHWMWCHFICLSSALLCSARVKCIYTDSSENCVSQELFCKIHHRGHHQTACQRWNKWCLICTSWDAAPL